jgi:hypothetical protein
MQPFFKNTTFMAQNKLQFVYLFGKKNPFDEVI